MVSGIGGGVGDVSILELTLRRQASGLLLSAFLLLAIH
jgi:hypothetical protein